MENERVTDTDTDMGTDTDMDSDLEMNMDMVQSQGHTAGAAFGVIVFVGFFLYNIW